MNINCWYCYIAEKKDEEDKCLKGKPIDWCDEHCAIYRSMKNAFSGSNLPQKYWYPFSLKNIPVDSKGIAQINEIRQNIDTFVNGGKNLLLQSNQCGNGKTSWGIKLLQKQIESHYMQSVGSWPPAFFIYVPNLLLSARESITNKSSNRSTLRLVLENCPLVLFDDIGCIPLKDYDLLILSSIIENRISAGLSSIYTTNLKDKQLATNLGDRLFDRINKLSTVITFNSTSLRGIYE